MKACDDLREEHKVVLLVLRGADALAAALRVKGGGDPRRVGDLLDFARNFVDRCHHGKEERHLFPMLVVKAGASGPVSVMLAEHEEGRRLVRRVEAAIGEGDPGGAAKELDAYAELLRAHIAKEDNVLFPLADRSLGEVDQQALKAAFDRLEADEMGEGAHERYHRMAHELAGAAASA